MRKFIDIIDEAVTKSGAKIEFQFEENIEPENRGFVLHRLTAHIVDHQVGYLKVDYIDDKEFERLNPEGIYSWMGNFRGFSFPDAGQTFDECTPRELYYFAHHLSHQEIHFENVDQFRSWLKEWEKTRSAKEFQKQYRDFLKYHVNKPKVAYISVEQNPRAMMPIEFKRQGVATALYCKMAHLMASKGMKFYASTLQQPEAKAAWDKMRRLGWTGRDKRGLFLDHTKCPEEYDATINR